MPLRYEIPGADELELEHLVLDINGTLTDRGELIDGVEERLGSLARSLEIHLASADTFGTLDALAARLGANGHRVSLGSDKLEFVERLGADRCAAIGNGRNDVELLDAAALGIAVIGPEGASAMALRAADVVCCDIVSALGLLLDARALASTLRP